MTVLLGLCLLGQSLGSLVLTVNISAEPSPLPQMIADLKVSGDYETRLNAARAFNLANRWKKRGISLVPMRYDHFIGDWIGVKFNCVISGESLTLHFSVGGKTRQFLFQCSEVTGPSVWLTEVSRWGRGSTQRWSRWSPMSSVLTSAW